MAKPFKFKQFNIYQDKCAMKVGTDGVLLGAFTNPTGKHNVLDVGTGTGLLALMMAQKDANCIIQAIEVDEPAYDQAKYNVSISKWKSRIEIAHISLQQFATITNDKFDLIISNPPYYEPKNEGKGGNLQQQSEQRKLARSTGSLTYKELINNAKHLLTDNGELSMVIPYHEFNNVKSLLQKAGLFLTRLTKVYSYNNEEPVRALLKASVVDKDYTEETIVIYETPTKHTMQYISYTKDFYLGTGKYFN